MSGAPAGNARPGAALGVRRHMNDVDELKQFAAAHARIQQMSRSQCRDLLGRIRTDDGDLPGSWVGEWCRDAGMFEQRGRMLDASRRYNMAGFPYVDGPARRHARDRGIQAFDRWRREHTDIQPLDIHLARGRVRCWVNGLSATHPRPVVLVMGGIVSVKEQWAPALLWARRMGMAGVVAEMPGVGENTLPYDVASWQMLSGVLDAVGDRADVAHTYAMTMSFSGHLALRCAANDARIRGIVTVGAPVSVFFTDTGWLRDLPRITVDTLAHLTRTEATELAGRIRDWRLTREELASLDIPVCYLASRRDEIIPGGEVQRLKNDVRHLHLLQNDDVHGSPQHQAETWLWAVCSVLRMLGGHRLLRTAIGSARHALRARHRLFGAVGR